MVHIGDSSFYAAVRDRLSSCDVVIFEGVRSFQGTLLSLAYRIPAKRKSLRLVLQSDALRRSDFRGVSIHGDMDSRSFALSWAEIPLIQRAALSILAPLYGVALYLFASREYLSRGHTVDSLSDRASDDVLEIRKVIADERDLRLIERVESYLAERRDGQRKVAILFGGAHMPAIAEVLTSRHGYRVIHSEWLTAIAA